ncbi:hypothetical protein OG889_10695 [Streptomyces sp. NBC_00481]|nr:MULTISPECIES: hypothetical protein [unclassified Streptomyces]WRY95157.1 hypothetical protein OG889_10695 [Streptomyces sp. NBC_00481]
MSEAPPLPGESRWDTVLLLDGDGDTAAASASAVTRPLSCAG